MKTTMSQGGVKAPDDGLAPCGCRVRFDNDGLIRLAACPMHAAAPDLLEACKRALAHIRGQKDGLVFSIEADLQVCIDKAEGHRKAGAK